jgi:glycosyltransferase involved in cell wall biosynthesis
MINMLGHRDMHFLYCGHGPDFEQLMSMANSYCLMEYFTFTGHRSDIRSILPGCDVAIHASTGEVGYSLSILEYMSAGLITLVPDTPSTSAATNNGVDGFLYKHRDVESAVSTCLSALSHNKRDQIRSNAIEKIRNEFDINNTNRALISALSQVFK